MDAYDNIINFLTFINEPHVRGIIMFWGIILFIVGALVYFILEVSYDKKKLIIKSSYAETIKVYIELDSNLVFINCYIDADQAKQTLEDNPTHQIHVHELKRKPPSSPPPRIINDGRGFKG